MNIENIIREKQIDGIYITNRYNIRFFTGFSGTTGSLYIDREGRKYFFTDFRYVEQAKRECEPKGVEIIKTERNSLETVANFIKKTGAKKIGIESKEVTLEFYKKIVEKLSWIELKEITDEILILRMRKSREEIEMVKKAAEIADVAYSEIIKEIKEGVSEKQIAAKLEYIMKMSGADDKSFDTIVASGYRSAMPHGVASSKKIGNNEFVKIDFGCYFNGYVSDMTRTVFYGDSISEKHIEVYNTVLEAQILGLKAVAAGVKANSVDSAAREYIVSKGYGENFGHGLGHGIGLEIHEMPYLSPSFETILEENMLVTIEPGIYIEGFGGVRIEDDVIVKSGGCEVINRSSKELRIIRRGGSN